MVWVLAQEKAIAFYVDVFIYAVCSVIMQFA